MTYQRKKAHWIGYILHGNFLLTHVIDGKTEVTEDEEEEVSSYWIILMKQEARN
jgi:hypothetical protein